MEYRFFEGEQAREWFPQIGRFRLTYFKRFPYLYSGTLEQELEWGRHFLESPWFLLAAALEGGDMAGLLTVTPLSSEAEIVRQCGQDFPRYADYCYLGELIVADEYRQQGVGRRLLGMAEEGARAAGYKGAAFLSVVREKDDLRRPADYFDTSALWERWGFCRTEASVVFEWPTIMSDGDVRRVGNRLALWYRDF